MLLKMLRQVSNVDRSRKRMILIGYDLAAMALALWGAFCVRLGEFYVPANSVVLLCALVAFVAGIAALYHLHVYRNILRYFGLRMVTRLMSGAGASAVAWMVAVYFTRAPFAEVPEQGLVPRSVVVIYCGFLFVLLFMGRYMAAELISGAHRQPPANDADDDEPAAVRKNIAIYGANDAGIRLAESIRDGRRFVLRAFIDDDPALHGQVAAGVPIYRPQALPDLARRQKLQEVFLAMPQGSRSQRLTAISRLTELNLKVKTVPTPEEIFSGRFTVSDVRPISVTDLLRRDPVQPLTELILQAVEGHSILITGAGGSIGSEICRQIVRARPRKMVLLDHSEFALYTIEQQLEEIAAGLPEVERPAIIPIVGSMLDQMLVRDLIAAQAVDTIYHAAAYKHVPLLEHNEVVGVENNVVGTLVLARCAMEAGISRFTMISTDKAVRPESVMGASKRVAELVIQAFAAQEDCRTRFGIVRFGNVLDSSGSVVQRFREQIQRGGPVTVTHKEVTRFFMSIPEATQLVLQASAMANHGEVFVLDMGEPVRISELARNMINLSGMSVKDERNPHGDVEIVFVGLRPGEKLYEELFVGEDAVATTHPRISMAKERFLATNQLSPKLTALQSAIAARDADAVRAQLRELIASDQRQDDEPGAADAAAIG